MCAIASRYQRGTIGDVSWFFTMKSLAISLGKTGVISWEPWHFLALHQLTIFSSRNEHWRTRCFLFFFRRRLDKIYLTYWWHLSAICVSFWTRYIICPSIEAMDVFDLVSCMLYNLPTFDASNLSTAFTWWTESVSPQNLNPGEWKEEFTKMGFNLAWWLAMVPWHCASWYDHDKKGLATVASNIFQDM